MEKRFLVWHEDQNAFFLLGYLLPLSARERQVVRVLLEQDCAAMDQIVTESTIPLQRHRIPAYVHSINAKAMAISGRKLLTFEDGEYRILAAM